MLEWGLKKFSGTPFGTTIILEAKGLKNRQEQKLKVRLFHEDGYIMTAIPVVCCMMQYLEDNIRKPGLWWQAHIVDPRKMLEQMQQLGIRIDISNE